MCTGLQLFTVQHVHSLEIRQLQLTLKKLLYKGVDFYVQNALKLTYEHLQFQKLFWGLYPRAPVKGGWEKGEGKGCVRLLGGWHPCRSVVNNENITTRSVARESLKR